MQFSVTSGNPSEEELLALKTALDNHKMQNLVPIIKRSVFGLPQLRKPLLRQNNFGAHRENR